LFWRAWLAIVASRGRCRRATLGRGAYATANMRSTTLCSQCDLPETRCGCERYCCYCQGQENIRLCMDGKYYCPDCREACEITVAESDAEFK